MARAAIGLLLALHGVAHAVGFTASWRLAASTDAPYTTLVLNGSIDVGDAGIRLVGILWLVAAAGMIAAAVQVWGRASHAFAAVAAATSFSLVMCLVGLPASQVGVAIDLLILAAVAVAAMHEGSLGEVAG